MAKKSPGSILKAKGLIPKEWDLRSLSRGQKSWITKQSKTFSEVIKKPKEYTTLKAASKRQKAEFRSAGLPVTNNRAVIKSGVGGKAHRTKSGKVVITNHERKVEMFFANGSNFEAELEKARLRVLSNNQAWTFSIAGRNANVMYRNLDHMLYYLENKTDWHTEDGEVPDGGEYISLVLVTVNRSHIIESLSDTPNASKEARAKKARKRKPK
jgi:hypothetical protein